jgi:hypothetical protein
MKCEELLRMLNDYVDGDIDPGICEEFQKHLTGCNPCKIVVDNIHKTITLYKNDCEYKMPVQFRRKLHEAMKRKWHETAKTGSGPISAP